MSDEGPTDQPPEEAPAEDPPAEDAPEDGGDGEEKADGAEGAEDEQEEEVNLHDLPIGERIAKDPIELGFLVPLPKSVSFEGIPRINDSKSVWR